MIKDRWLYLLAFILLVLAMIAEVQAATHPVKSTSTCYLRKIGGSWVKICG